MLRLLFPSTRPPGPFIILSGMYYRTRSRFTSATCVEKCVYIPLRYWGYKIISLLESQDGGRVKVCCIKIHITYISIYSEFVLTNVVE